MNDNSSRDLNAVAVEKKKYAEAKFLYGVIFRKELEVTVGTLLSEKLGTYTAAGTINVATPNFTPRVKPVVSAGEKKVTYSPTFSRRPKVVTVRKPYEARGGFTFAQAIESASI